MSNYSLLTRPKTIFSVILPIYIPTFTCLFPETVEYIHVELGTGDHDIDTRIVGMINNKRVMTSINKSLEKLHVCMCVDGAELGSVVIYLRRREGFQHVWNTETVGHIATTITEVVLSTEEISRLIGRQRKTLNISVQLRHHRVEELGKTGVIYIQSMSNTYHV